MNLTLVDHLVARLKDADLLEAFKIDLELRLSSLRETIMKEGAAEEQAQGLQASWRSIPIRDEPVFCVPPISPTMLLGLMGEVGKPTHILVRPGVHYDFYHDLNVFHPPAHLAASAKVKGFVAGLPVVEVPEMVQAFEQDVVALVVSVGDAPCAVSIQVLR